MPIKTHSRQTQTELGLTSEEWDVLYDYVKEIEGALEAETTDIGGVEEVEEDPPSIDSNGFSPGGWVGLYPGGVTVVPRHISEPEYETLLNETQKWIEIICNHYRDRVSAVGGHSPRRSNTVRGL